MSTPDDVWPETVYHHPEKVGREVIRLGPDGPAVVVLHEMAGLTEQTLGLARFLADHGYQVHLPLLFGPLPTQDARRVGNATAAWRLCVSREIAVFRANRSSPAADHIRSLCRRLAAEPTRRVGVIGMCATGGVVLSIMWDDAVSAAVASQPALPLRPFFARTRDDNLGASRRDVARAAASGTPLQLFAFSRDPLCPAGRIAGYQGALPMIKSQTYTSRRRSDHAVLTDHTDHAPGARTRLVAFLDEHLGE